MGQPNNAEQDPLLSLDMSSGVDNGAFGPWASDTWGGIPRRTYCCGVLLPLALSLRHVNAMAGFCRSRSQLSPIAIPNLECAWMESS